MDPHLSSTPGDEIHGRGTRVSDLQLVESGELEEARGKSRDHRDPGPDYRDLGDCARSDTHRPRKGCRIGVRGAGRAY